MNDKYLKSMPLRILGTVMLCVCGTLAVLSGMVWNAGDEFGMNCGIGNFSDTQFIRDRVMSAADEIVSNYIYLEDGTYMRNMIYEEGTSNISYTLYMPVCPGSTALTETAENFTAENYGYRKMFEYHSYNLSEEEMEKLGFDPESVSPSAALAKIEVRVIDPLSAPDEIYRRYSNYRIAEAYFPYSLPVLIASIILFVLSLIYMLASAGHVKGHAGICLNRFDRIPLELAAAPIIFAGLMLGGIAIDLIFDPVYFVLMNVVCGIALMMAGGLLFLWLLMTISARIKSGTLLESTLIFRIWKMAVYYANDAFRMIPSVWMALALGIVWFLVKTFLYRIREFDLALITDMITVILYLWIVIQARHLEDAGSRLAAGNMDYRIQSISRMPLFLQKHAEDLNSVGDGIRIAVEEKTKSERMRTELITNVSHDIKTPLTSIINYADLLQKEHTEEEQKEYLEVISRQAARLKQMTMDIVDASKATAGTIDVELREVNVGELMEQAAAEYEEKLQGQNLEVIRNLKDGPLSVYADGRLLWRVFSNLLSNCVKYALPGTRVYMDADRDGQGMIRISVKNISRDQLNISSDELMERFVRGDESRHTEGSGLGLSIARSLCELMHGTFSLTIDGDLFRADICLPEYRQQKELLPPESAERI